jgi:hypothetical protein
MIALAGLILTLWWTPAQRPDVGGYVLKWGPAAEVWTNAVDCGTNLSATVALADGFYAFNVTFYSKTGEESPASNTVFYECRTPRPATNVAVLVWEGSRDLVSWTGVSTNFLTNVSVQTFYRARVFMAVAGSPAGPHPVKLWAPKWKD